MNIYYVYAYLRNKDSATAKAGTPYYIGKGKHNRAHVDHRKNNNGIPTPTNRQYIIFLETNLTELGAFAIERRMIKWYGRKDTATGILSNRTDGGEGPAGMICSIETKQKISKSNQGKIRTNEIKNKLSTIRKGIPWNKDRIHSPDTLDKIRDANLGRIMTIEDKAKMSIAAKARPPRPGILHTDSAKNKMSVARKGKPWSEARIEAQKNRTRKSCSSSLK